MGYWSWTTVKSIYGEYEKMLGINNRPINLYTRIQINANGQMYAALENRYGGYETLFRIDTIASIGQEYRARFNGTFKYDSGDSIPVSRTSPGIEAISNEGTYANSSEISISGRGTISGTLYLEQRVYVPTPPSPPLSITVPTEIKVGQQITISWGSVSGATRYHLERRVNGGSWIEIYSGTNTSYTDSVGSTWNSVAYRVRAYNEDGYSSYRTSSTITVTHFPEFKMRINGELKTSENGWVKIEGQLREIEVIWVKVNGQLKEV